MSIIDILYLFWAENVAKASTNNYQIHLLRTNADEKSNDFSSAFTFIVLPMNGYRYRTPLGWASTSFPWVGKSHQMPRPRQHPRSSLRRWRGYTSTFCRQARSEQVRKREVRSGSYHPQQSSRSSFCSSQTHG